jgi:hypothetical protein
MSIEMPVGYISVRFREKVQIAFAKLQITELRQREIWTFREEICFFQSLPPFTRTAPYWNTVLIIR